MVLVLGLVPLLAGCALTVSTRSAPSRGPVPHRPISEAAALRKLSQVLDIPVLRPNYLPPGFVMASGYDVRQARGENPLIHDREHAELEYQHPEPVKGLDHSHRWLRVHMGTSSVIGNITTANVSVRGHKALVVSSKRSQWAIVTWVEPWRRKRIRYAVEGEGLPTHEILKVARSLRELYH